MTKIEWTRSDDGTAGRTWNPTTGCDKVSPGCGLARPGTDDDEQGTTGGCYAMAMAKRLKAMGQPKYQHDGDPKTSGPGFGLTVHADVLTLPLRWRKPSRVFVNSMSDLFHADVPDEFITRVFAVMMAAPQHTFQLLTKRHGPMHSLLRGPFADRVFDLAVSDYGLPAERDQERWWPLPNVHLGASVEDQYWADIRIPALLDTPAAVRWLSCEPLLGPLDLHRWLKPTTTECTCAEPDVGAYTMHESYCGMEPPQIGWVVCGGESAPDARPMQLDWVRSIVDQCQAVGVPVFVKQLGAVWARDWFTRGKTVAASGDPKGGDAQYWPADLRVREFPTVAGVVA